MTAKPQLRAGITLIEVIIVMAISAMLVVIVVSVGQSRGRREFDVNMKALASAIQTAQNAAAAGIGPDPQNNCNSTAPKVDPSAPIPLCPFVPAGGNPTVSELAGTAMVFAPGGKVTKLGDYHPVIGRSGGSTTSLSTAYYSYNVSNYFFVAYGYGTPVKHQMPADIGFIGACLANQLILPAPTACPQLKTQAMTLLFGRFLNGAASGTLDYNGSSLQLVTDAAIGTDGTDSTQYVGDPSPPLKVIGSNPGYCPGAVVGCTTANHQDIFLNFQDFSGQYHATITLHTKDNTIDLDLK